MATADHYVYYVYVDGIVRYVGKGSRDRCTYHQWVARRLFEGLPTRVRPTKFQERLAGVMRRGGTVRTMIVAGDLDDEDAFLLERAHIAKIGRSQLWNATDGGDGLSRADAERINSCPKKRAATGLKIKAVWACPDYRAMQSASHIARYTPELRKAHGLKVKASWTPERRQAQADRLRQRWASMAPQERKATAEARKKPIETPDRKEQRSSIAKSRHLADPSLAIATIARNQAMWSNPASGLRNRRDPSPEVKAAGYAKVGASTKRRWADRTPEEKARLANQTSETLKRRNAERRLAEGREIVRVRTPRRKYATT